MRTSLCILANGSTNFGATIQCSGLLCQCSFKSFNELSSPFLTITVFPRFPLVLACWSSVEYVAEAEIAHSPSVKLQYSLFWTLSFSWLFSSQAPITCALLPELILSLSLKSMQGMTQEWARGPSAGSLLGFGWAGPHAFMPHHTVEQSRR